MGNIITISCRKCNYDKEFLIGVGELFFESQKNPKKIVNKLSGININDIIIEDNFEQVFRCFNCNRLSNKSTITYKLKDSIFIFQIFYKCTKCKLPLYPLFNDSISCTNYYMENNKMENIENYESEYYQKTLEDIPCYKCGMRELYMNGWGYWD